MQLTIVTLLGFAGAALAQVAGFDAITSPPEGSTLKAGETFEIVWEPAPAEFDDSPIDIILLAGGSPSTLSPVDPAIATGVTNKVGSFSWDVPADLGNDKTYGIKIVLQSDPKTFQFSFPFAITPSKGGSTPKGNSTTTSKPKPTGTSSSDAEETSTTSYKAKTTLYTTVDDSDATAPTSAPTTKASPGAGPQVTAGAFAILGGLAIAALGL